MKRIAEKLPLDYCLTENALVKHGTVVFYFVVRLCYKVVKLKIFQSGVG